MAEGWRGIRVTIPSDVRYLDPLRTMIQETAALAGLGRDAVAEVELAVTEGCANVIRHVYSNSERERIDLRRRRQPGSNVGARVIEVDPQRAVFGLPRIDARPVEWTRAAPAVEHERMQQTFGGHATRLVADEPV